MIQSPDQYRNELTSFRVILEGLIHNINTPLNLVMGYVQKKQKQDPECEILGRIYDAALKIDDILQRSYKNVIHRTVLRKTDFDLVKWLDEEISFMSNDLKFKHHSRIDFEPASQATMVNTSALLLALTFESLISCFMGIETDDLIELKIRCATNQQTTCLEIECRDRKGLEPAIQMIADKMSQPTQIIGIGDIKLSALYCLSVVKTNSVIKANLRIL